jgi:hypothetical protein
MAVASFEELIGEKESKVPGFEELAGPEVTAPELTEGKVPSFDELAPMGLSERAVKGYLNKTILEATEKGHGGTAQGRDLVAANQGNSEFVVGNHERLLRSAGEGQTSGSGRRS